MVEAGPIDFPAFIDPARGRLLPWTANEARRAAVALIVIRRAIRGVESLRGGKRICLEENTAETIIHPRIDGQVLIAVVHTERHLGFSLSSELVEENGARAPGRVTARVC